MAPTKEKSIIFLISSLTGGGAEGVCVNIANLLSERGWHVTLIVLHLDNAVNRDNVSKKITLISLGIKNARKSVFSLAKLLASLKPKKIVVFNYELAVIAFLIKTILIKDMQIIARNINSFSKKVSSLRGGVFKNIARLLITKTYGNIDHVINQCYDMERDLLTALPTLKGKTSVIYNPVSLKVFNYLALKKHGKPKNGNFLLCIGRLEPQKSFEFAIKAFAVVRNSNSDLKLKILGIGSKENELKTLAKSLGVDSYVEFEGFISDPIPYYINAMGTILTSQFEGFPNILIESITLGTPVIAFDCPNGPREIIKQGVNGYLVKQNDTGELAKAMHLLIDKPMNADEIIATAKCFYPEKIIEQYISRLE